MMGWELTKVKIKSWFNDSNLLNSVILSVFVFFNFNFSSNSI